MGTLPDIDWELPITDEVIRSFLDAKGVPIKCELCATTGWSSTTAQPLGALPMVTMICQNCGNMRLHLAATIRRWRDKGY